VRILCRVLGVTTGDSTQSRKRPKSSREREDGELTEKIVEIFQAHRGVYGSPRIHAALAEQGIHIGRKRVVRLMQQVRLSAHCRTHRVVTTKANPKARVAENVLDRQFEADRPNQKWVADVTYVSTASGWLYAGRWCSICFLDASSAGPWRPPLTLSWWSKRLLWRSREP